MPDDYGNGLASLFVAHAGGYVTERALEERRVLIMQYMVEHKFTISEETLQELRAELSEISVKLGES